MSDIIDNASDLEELQRNAALSLIRINRNAVSALHCMECEEEIPEARRKTIPGCQLCASCKQIDELRNKSGSRRS
ncbi:TraR/DksA family transcriptional regulator [Buttiauxella selenatireducens]|uniref:TraR/DksA family transcriptional regulator n=1 Tax=Buttiauxella selenatireducens TaxID=3073902 RepID=A0ABY9SH25_9ENTR|nr:TraR/DksA family transcriptional regulator [Buttiauxella sp. R73]WMY75382.1 TraR/DksA family transcriptional regulator [Buttiauxella sp. R73]